MPASSDPDEMTEALDSAWEHLDAARELLGYAAMLIDNTSERERVNLVAGSVRRARNAMVQAVMVWDVSPVLKKVREDHAARTEALTAPQGAELLGVALEPETAPVQGPTPGMDRPGEPSDEDPRGGERSREGRKDLE
jgi:hypothetical protein